ncbi:MAG: iron-sulfur cluster assembly protein [candidate division WOR-3 bacterium]|nr:iron-sulfur cluster assembly protein [candidate division WOR-3 bacterium]
MNKAWRLPIRLVTTIVLVGIGILVMNLPALLRRQRLPALGLSAATTFTDSANVPVGTPTPDSAAVASALGRVVDPEIGISIVDLGLVNSLQIDSAGTVKATIILTIPECPYAQHLGAQAAKEVISVPGVRRVRVRLDPTLPWDPSHLGPKARELYRKRFGGGLPRLRGLARLSSGENRACTQSLAKPWLYPQQ